MPNARDFLMSSDHQMDKIIFFKEQKVSPDSFGYAKIDVGLPFCPLVFGVWSNTPDFAVCQPFIQGGVVSYRTYDILADSVSLEVSSLSLSGNPEIQLNASFTTNHDYHVRIYGFMPSDKNLVADITSTNAREMILSSDFNYRKLHSAGVLPYTVDMMTGQASSVTIAHNLGYLPQVMVWLETSDSSNPNDVSILPFQFTERGNSMTPFGNITITNSSVIVTPVSPQWGNVYKIHYRIYYDEA